MKALHPLFNKNMDPSEHLSHELFLHIISFRKISCLGRCQRVSKRWQLMLNPTDNEWIWNKLIQPYHPTSLIPKIIIYMTRIPNKVDPVKIMLLNKKLDFSEWLVRENDGELTDAKLFVKDYCLKQKIYVGLRRLGIHL